MGRWDGMKTYDPRTHVCVEKGEMERKDKALRDVWALCCERPELQERCDKIEKLISDALYPD